MIAVILMTTTCSKPLSKSLSKAQLKEYTDLLPEHPKRNTFTLEEQKQSKFTSSPHEVVGFEST